MPESPDNPLKRCFPFERMKNQAWIILDDAFGEDVDPIEITAAAEAVSMAAREIARRTYA